MRIATQEDLDKFVAKYILDPDIYPFLQISKTNYGFNLESGKNDWDKIWLVSENIDCLLKVSIGREFDNDFNIGLWSKSTFQAGKAIKMIEGLIIRYRPRSLNSVVHASNTKSIKVHNKIFGAPWGIEKSAAWNMGTGQYEDLLYYRKLLVMC